MKLWLNKLEIILSNENLKITCIRGKSHEIPVITTIQHAAGRLHLTLPCFCTVTNGTNVVIPCYDGTPEPVHHLYIHPIWINYTAEQVFQAVPTVDFLKGNNYDNLTAIAHPFIFTPPADTPLISITRPWTTSILKYQHLIPQYCLILWNFVLSVVVFYLVRRLFALPFPLYAPPACNMCRS